jgi:drug/metabolite transporter (DMT)-like permease
MVLGLVAAVGWAVGTMVLKHRAVVVTPLVLTGWQLLITAVPMGLGALLFPGAPVGAAAGGPSPTVWLLIVYITLVPMAIGNLAWFTVVGLLPTTVAGLSSIMVPVVAMLTGAMLHGEPLGAAQLAAMACCAAAMWLALSPRLAQPASPSDARVSRPSDTVDEASPQQEENKP